eukprot:CAMPEP_0181127958 /NCGR_PEP_ID=MMETSP1071-20121207/28488_1 /TAXON_ID=35127 /ORGANISM="Thalassiosira sp., Strain NH16" /LENGTH=35 /DNA_ID= /DNA_START= /DNA_END= /DNA_ORIENTATION=
MASSLLRKLPARRRSSGGTTRRQGTTPAGAKSKAA